MVGVSSASVSQWESGDRNPSHKSRAKLQKAFGVHLDAVPVPDIHTAASLYRFLETDLGKAMVLTESEKADIVTCRWFGPEHEDPTPKAWVEFIHLRRGLKLKT